MIQLDEFYRIEDDPSCWALIYEKSGTINEKTGKPKITRDVSYHANLKQALAMYLDESFKGSTDIQHVLNRIAEVERKIEAL